MMRCTAFCGLVLVAATGALAFRLPRLDQRPMHTDEAVQALKTGCLAEAGEYCYDPTEFHGPSLYYITLPSLWLTAHGKLADSGEYTFRIVPVLFGVGLILLLLLMRDGLGSWTAVCAGAFTAISPAMVFYSRYYVQEMLLVFFTVASIAMAWRYVRSRRLAWALLAGAALGLTHATKETCIIAFASMLAALFFARLWERRDAAGKAHQPVNTKHLIGAGVVACAVSVVFFSSFFRNLRGPLDSILTYVGYLRKGSGAGLHDHPWYHYLKMLIYTHYAPGPWWSEGLIVALALLGVIAIVAHSKSLEGHLSFLRFLALYTVFMVIAYSLLPYKTPWCMLSFLQAMILLAGVGAVALVKMLPNTSLKIAATLLLALGAGQLAWQAYQASFRFYADNRGPYVYAHPVSDIVNMGRTVEDIAKVHPDGRKMLIKVIAPRDDYWPIPWYFRKFGCVGYWNYVPDDPDAPVLVASSSVQPGLDQKLRDSYEVSCFGLRPQVVLCLYVKKDVWKAFMDARSKAGRP